MKVIQINVVYKIGSTGRIIDDINDTLILNKHESYILYAVGPKSKSSNIKKIAYKYELSFYRIMSSIFGLQYNSSFFSTMRIFSFIKKIKPDIVHLHVINGYTVNIYKLLEYLSKKNLKTVISLHSEYMFTGSCGHSYDCDKWKTGCGNCPIRWEATHSYFLDRTKKAWNLMYNSVNSMNNVVFTSVSTWLYNKAVIAPITANKKNYLVLNGINTNIFKFKENNKLKPYYNIQDKKILLHVTANFSNNKSDIKGGFYIFELAKRLIGTNFVIMIIGNNNNDGFLDNMISVGKIHDPESLAEYYSIADLTLLTSRRETFSMPTIESLSCGTPVLGFYAGGPESIAIKEYSEFIRYGDIESMIERILHWTKDDNKIDKNVISQHAHSIYSREIMTKNYLKIYQDNEACLNEPNRNK